MKVQCFQEMPDRAIETQTFAGAATELSVLAKAILSSVSRALDVVRPHQFSPAGLNTCMIFLAWQQNILFYMHVHQYIYIYLYAYVNIYIYIRIFRPSSICMYLDT